MESTHVSALQMKHAGLERQIAEEMSRPSPDQSAIQMLKKRKLRIKEELQFH
ncbi:YdcH family protein [Novosphingobium flavum]|uniref:YdcH family protein n=1 Tax=Novosphingobium flavum TaxID=1778672 RepID=A0A7X1KML7_9SPHN|nr:YdcH family protein [Novosphingobium flavum]MBC2666764.1 YdcH family protein [Novosphingobium flavum]